MEIWIPSHDQIMLVFLCGLDELLSNEKAQFKTVTYFLMRES